VKKDNFAILEEKIKKKKAKIGIIGLGYVGLPLALTFVKEGFEVTGIDIDDSRIRRIKKGISYITDISDFELQRALKTKRLRATASVTPVRSLDAVIICVPTPLDSKRKPDVSFIKEASVRVRDNMKKGQLIVLESTTYPGTTKEVLLPIFESTGLKEGMDFYLAFSPERIDPGNRTYKTENTPKIVGGISKNSTKITEFLYKQVVKRVVPVSSASAAEMVKLLENTFRIVNIALVNEIAILSDKFNLDIWEVIDAAKTKPYGYMPFYPGPGCGGHCIPVDPLYLSWKARQQGYRTKFITLAASVNEAMPKYVVERITRILAEDKRSLHSAEIMVVGVAYKNDVKDLRESPALRIIRLLQRNKSRVSYYDPLFPFIKAKGINLKQAPFTREFLRRQDFVVIVTAHSSLDYGFIAEHAKAIFDTRGILRKTMKGKNRKFKEKIFSL